MNTSQKLSRLQITFLILSLQLIVLLAAMDETIVAPVMPKIISALGGLDRFSWVGTAYLLAAVGAMPMVGYLSDRFGRKKLLLGSAAIFVLSSIMCGMAGFLSFLPGDAMSQLIAFRVLQGISGGGLEGLCLATLNDVFGPIGRVKYMWLLSLSCAVAAIFGPISGGLISSLLSWRWVFFINLPIGIIGMLTLSASMPQFAIKSPSENCDVAGMLALVAAIVSLLLALDWGITIGVATVPVLCSLIIAVISFALFVWIENSCSKPAIPLTIFRNQTVLHCIGGQMLTGAYMVCATYFLPLFFSVQLHKSGIETAQLFTPFMLSMVGGSIISGQLLSRKGFCQLLGFFGAILAAVGFYALAKFGMRASDLTIAGNSILVGLGIGLRLPVHSLLAQLATPPSISGLVVSLMQALRDIGGSIGLVLASSLMLALSVQSQPHSFSNMGANFHCIAAFYICAAIAVASAILDTLLPQEILHHTTQSKSSSNQEIVSRPHTVLTQSGYAQNS